IYWDAWSDRLERRISGIVMYLLARQEARRLLVVALALIFGSLTVRGQNDARSNRAERTNVLTIVNPSKIDIPGDRARVLLLTTCRVVADEFHRKPQDVELTMTLVLGEKDERYSIDTNGRMTMYLEHWDEGRFVDGVILNAVHGLAPLHLRKQ